MVCPAWDASVPDDLVVETEVAIVLPGGREPPKSDHLDHGVSQGDSRSGILRYLAPEGSARRLAQPARRVASDPPLTCDSTSSEATSWTSASTSSARFGTHGSIAIAIRVPTLRTASAKTVSVIASEPYLHESGLGTLGH